MAEIKFNGKNHFLSDYKIKKKKINKPLELATFNQKYSKVQQKYKKKSNYLRWRKKNFKKLI